MRVDSHEDVVDVRYAGLMHPIDPIQEPYVNEEEPRDNGEHR